MTRRFVRTGLFVAAPVLLVLALKVFLFDVYRVDSGSMEPAIRGSRLGGELVLVRYDREPSLARFDLVVVLREGEREPAVKRVVGLPGEEVRLAGGDLLIDGAKLGPDAPRPWPVRVFDARWHDLHEHFECEPRSAFETQDGDVVVEAPEAPENGRAAGGWRAALTDDFVRADGERVAGRADVADARLSARVRIGAAGTFSFGLSEEGDHFAARLEVSAEEAARAVLVRERRGLEPTELVSAELPFAFWRFYSVVFANVDDHLVLEVDGRRVLVVSYDGNTPLGGVADPRQLHRRPRATFGVEAGAVRFRHLTLARDLHYTERGPFGRAEPVRLGPGEIFVLGDNSAESVDGREWGPIALDEVIGVPVAVPWPLAAARRLVPVAPVPPRAGEGP